jgi:hypothetical protein
MVEVVHEREERGDPCQHGWKWRETNKTYRKVGHENPRNEGRRRKVGALLLGARVGSILMGFFYTI